MDDRLAAWDRVHPALAALPGWRATQPVYHAEVRRWQATAIDGRRLGREATRGDRGDQ